jgi:hypothetical protein
MRVPLLVLLMLGIVVFTFYLLTPGILISLPPGQPLYVQAVVHGVVFTGVFYVALIPIFKILGRGIE